MVVEHSPHRVSANLFRIFPASLCKRVRKAVPKERWPDMERVGSYEKKVFGIHSRTMTWSLAHPRCLFLCRFGI